MMSWPFGLFTQVSGSGPLGPLVIFYLYLSKKIRLDFSEDSLETAGLIFSEKQ